MSNVAIGIDFEVGMLGMPVRERFVLRNPATSQYLSRNNFTGWEWGYFDGTDFSKREAARLIDRFLKLGVHLVAEDVRDL